jgi:hypothetical protein
MANETVYWSNPFDEDKAVARVFQESLTMTTDMDVLPCVLGCRPLRRTIQVRFGTNTAVPRDAPRWPARLALLAWLADTPILVVSPRQFMKHPG